MFKKYINVFFDKYEKKGIKLADNAHVIIVSGLIGITLYQVYQFARGDEEDQPDEFQGMESFQEARRRDLLEKKRRRQQERDS